MLKGLKVLEFEGLAPTVFAGMMLADYGAEITIISRPGTPTLDNLMNRGKTNLSLDLKNQEDFEKLLKLIPKADVVIDAFRPGVLEKLKLGYENLKALNPKIILCRVSSYGQHSPLKDMAGHDLNFISYSGILSLIASETNRPGIPVNLIGDFAVGGAMAVASILAAVYHVKNGGLGQEIDMGMAQGTFYLSQFILDQKRKQIWINPRGKNILDGGAHFYNVYECKDGKYFSVACIEEKFYKEFINILQQRSQINAQHFLDNQFNTNEWDSLKQITQSVFKTKSRDEWEQVFQKVDACCSPVLDLDEAVSRKSLGDIAFIRDGSIEARSQPIFSGFTNLIQKWIPNPKL